MVVERKAFGVKHRTENLANSMSLVIIRHSAAKCI